MAWRKGKTAWLKAWRLGGLACGGWAARLRAQSGLVGLAGQAWLAKLGGRGAAWLGRLGCVARRLGLQAWLSWAICLSI